MTFKNITVKRFKAMHDVSDYMMLSGNLKPNNLFCGKQANLNILTYDEVKLVIKLLSKKELEWSDLDIIYEIVYKVDDIDEGLIFDFFKSKAYIENESIKIAEKEINLLQSNNDNADKWKRAGIERLAPFSDLSNKIRLAKDYGVLPSVIGKMKYNEVLTLLAYENISGNVVNEFEKIK
jgi:hypothetical protein